MTDDATIHRMSGPEALELYSRLVAADIEFWVVGGWGVDALIGHQTRPHHDLDIFVNRTDLGHLLEVLPRLGFSERLIWKESVWIDVNGEPRPSAFVHVDRAGHELDVHVIDLPADGIPLIVGDVPWVFTESDFEAVGVIAGGSVRCVSATMQLQMHIGYDLPAQHRTDVQRLLHLQQSQTG